MALGDLSADEINAAAERVEQDALRSLAKRAVRDGRAPKHYFADDDTFDQIPGGMVVRRDRQEHPLRPFAPGEYGG